MAILMCGFVMILLLFRVQSKHVVRRLIILEGLILLSIRYLFFIIAQVSSVGLLLLLFAFAASEAALGLSLLIIIIRLYRNDNIINILL